MGIARSRCVVEAGSGFLAASASSAVSLLFRADVDWGCKRVGMYHENVWSSEVQQEMQASDTEITADTSALPHFAITGKHCAILPPADYRVRS